MLIWLMVPLALLAPRPKPLFQSHNGLLALQLGGRAVLAARLFEFLWLGSLSLQGPSNTLGMFFPNDVNSHLEMMAWPWSRTPGLCFVNPPLSHRLRGHRGFFPHPS